MKSKGTDRRRSRNAAMIGAAAASLAVISLLFLGPGSIKTLISQRHQTQALQTKIATIDKANAALVERRRELNDPQTIAYLARQNYGMVPKGAKAYAILPSPTQSLTLAGTWPFVVLKPVSPTAPQGGPTTIP